MSSTVCACEVGVGGQSLGKPPCFVEERERIWESQRPSWKEGQKRAKWKEEERGEMTQLAGWEETLGVSKGEKEFLGGGVAGGESSQRSFMFHVQNVHCETFCV